MTRCCCVERFGAQKFGCVEFVAYLCLQGNCYLCVIHKGIACSSLFQMLGGHFKLRRRYFFLRTIKNDEKVSFEEKVSSNSSTSKDPTLIVKPDTPKIDGEPHPSDRIVKAIQIQTGSGKLDKAVEEEGLDQESDSDSSNTSDSSISLNLDTIGMLNFIVVNLNIWLDF